MIIGVMTKYVKILELLELPLNLIMYFFYLSVQLCSGSVKLSSDIIVELVLVYPPRARSVNSLPQKFTIHVLDDTHLFVPPQAAEMIRRAISEFRDQNSYEKPA